MIYTIVVEDGVFGVNGDFRKIDLSVLGNEISSVQFDTERQTGVVLYKPTVFDEVSERDFEAERRLLTAARLSNKPEGDVQPQYKAVAVRRPRKVLSSFPYEMLIPFWEQAAPPSPPEPAEPAPLENRIPLRELLRVLVQKGVLSEEDIQQLRSSVREV